MQRGEKTSWREFHNFVRERQVTFKEEDAEKEDRLRRKISREISRSQSDLSKKKQKQNKKQKNKSVFNRNKKPAKPKGILKSSRPKDNNETGTDAPKFYHDTSKVSFLADRFDENNKPVRENSTFRRKGDYSDDDDGEIYYSPRPPVSRSRPRGRVTWPYLKKKTSTSPTGRLPPLKPAHPYPVDDDRYNDPPIASNYNNNAKVVKPYREQLTYYDKPVRRYPSYEDIVRESKPRTRYTSQSVPPVSREKPKDPKRGSQRSTGKRDTEKMNREQEAPFVNDRYNRILPRLEENYNLSPRPRRSKEKPANSTRTSSLDEFPVNRDPYADYYRPPGTTGRRRDDPRVLESVLISDDGGRTGLGQSGIRNRRVVKHYPTSSLSIDNRDVKAIIPTDRRDVYSQDTDSIDSNNSVTQLPIIKDATRKPNGNVGFTVDLSTDEARSRQGYRYKRDVVGKKRQPLLPKLNEDDESFNSVSTNSDRDVITTVHRIPSPKSQRIVYDENVIPETPRSGRGSRRTVIDNDEPIFGEEMYTPRSSEQYSKHKHWPIYKYTRDGGIACMVRASPKVIEEVKKNLVLVDGLSREDQVRMPVLPANEFDADEHIVLSPMQLHWQYPAYDGKNSSKTPVYVIMPVNSTVYNDALQQMLFMYTADYQPWKFAEGRIIRLPVDGLEHEFYEAVIREPFDNIIFDMKARYLENVKMIPPDGGEINSTMEPGIRLFVHKRTFDEVTKVKLRVEPLDMNETELHMLIPSSHTLNAVAVSPVIKVTAMEVTKRPVTLIIPKPGTTIFGSTKLGVRTKILDLRSVRVQLWTKDRQISKYQIDPNLQREHANEYEFNIRIWKSGGSCYAFLVLTGLEPQLQTGINGRRNADELGERDFLSTSFFRQLVTGMEPDELKFRSFGRQLLNYSTTNEIFRNHKNQTPLAGMKVLKRWRNQNKKHEEGSMVRQLVIALRETGFTKSAIDAQSNYRIYLTEQEGKKLLEIFDELRFCPAVMINWHMLGRVLGLADRELGRIQESSRDLRKRCYATLRRSFDLLRNEEQFYRDVLIKYIDALKQIGCPRIAGNIERRYLPKFYLNPL